MTEVSTEIVGAFSKQDARSCKAFLGREPSEYPQILAKMRSRRAACCPA